jgi:hypothetical protein
METQEVIAVETAPEVAPAVKPEVAPAIKPDVVLSDGKAIHFDKRKIKTKEWRDLFSKDQTDEDGWRVIGKFAGLTYEYVSELSIYDWQLLFGAAIAKVREPVDPNLARESISQS